MGGKPKKPSLIQVGREQILFKKNGGFSSVAMVNPFNLFPEIPNGISSKVQHFRQFIQRVIVLTVVGDVQDVESLFQRKFDTMKYCIAGNGLIISALRTSA